MQHKWTILALVISCFFSVNASASTEKVEAYLTNLKTLKANFQQVAPDGSKSSGKFLLKRPNKMRWEYNPPAPILMVTRGNFLTYYDYSVDQVSDIPLDETLLGVLTNKTVDFKNSNITVAESFEKNGKFHITLEQKDAADQGSLGMIFSQSPWQLEKLIVIDATQSATHINFSNIIVDTPIDDKAFAFKDPRTGGVNKKSKRLNK